MNVVSQRDTEGKTRCLPRCCGGGRSPLDRQPGRMILLPMRCLLLHLACCLALGAADQALVADDLYGIWELDAAAASEEQQEALKAAQAVDGFGLTLTLRMARVVLGPDHVVAGMWRLDEATPTTAVLVVQPRGRDEARYHLTVTGTKMVVAEAPGQLPLIKTR